ASHPLRDASVVVEDIEDNPGFFRVKLYAVPHFQVEGMDVNLSLVSQMPKAKASAWWWKISRITRASSA
ncbi:hypothetical protein MUW96_23325, partial [Klebsiella pneumoniae]|nr:hypothetical protein [Klebsiella pneumoniae]